MKRSAIIVLLLLLQACAGLDRREAMSSANVPVSPQPVPAVTFDLARIYRVAPKGRIQDAEYNPHLQEQIDALVARGPKCVDYLIEKIADETRVDQHVFDYWPVVHRGDVAVRILFDLFQEPSGRGSTLPGAEWNEFLERGSGDRTAFEVYAIFLGRNGRDGLQRKWKRLWERHRAAVEWDPGDRCFRRATEVAWLRCTGRATWRSTNSALSQ